MRLQGNLKKWNDDRGFGFIVSPQRKNEFFVHISAFPRDGQRPKIGEKITFEVEIDKNGKSRAIRVLRTGTRSYTRKKVVSKRIKNRVNLKTVIIICISAFIAYNGYNSYAVRENYKPVTSTPKIMPEKKARIKFSCDGRQHCSQMSSREEAEYFIQNCPNTKMDGDNDGVPCENDSRF